MAWSTRELAELAGTTVNTVRHYHRLGLLEQPARRYNGYKQYEVRHLVSLLRIRRLTALGVPLAKISAVSAGSEGTREALSTLYEEIQSNIERLEQAQTEIAAILRDELPADAPAEFASVASRLSEADGSIIHIYRMLYDDKALGDIREMIETDSEVLSAELDALPADADPETKRHLIETLTPIFVQKLLDYPWLSNQEPHLSTSPHDAEQTLTEAVIELYGSV